MNCCHVLYPVDLRGNRGLRSAIRIAAANGATLSLLHVVGNRRVFPTDVELMRAVEAAHWGLKKLQATITEVPCAIHLALGDVAPQIVAFTRLLEIEIVVIDRGCECLTKKRQRIGRTVMRDAACRVVSSEMVPSDVVPSDTFDIVARPGLRREPTSHFSGRYRQTNQCYLTRS